MLILSDSIGFQKRKMNTSEIQQVADVCKTKKREYSLFFVLHYKCEYCKQM